MNNLLLVQRYQPGKEPHPLVTENARLRSALGRARRYIITNGPVNTNKKSVLEKIEMALK